VAHERTFLVRWAARQRLRLLWCRRSHPHVRRDSECCNRGSEGNCVQYSLERGDGLRDGTSTTILHRRHRRSPAYKNSFPLYRNFLSGGWEHHGRCADDFDYYYAVSLRHGRHCCLCLSATLGILARQSGPWLGVYTARQLQIRDSCARSLSNRCDCLPPRSDCARLVHSIQRYRFSIRCGPFWLLLPRCCAPALAASTWRHQALP